MLIRDEGMLTPIEIKSSSTFNPDLLKGIRNFRAVAGDRTNDGFLLYNGQQTFDVQGVCVMNPLAKP